jgi:hypothetical protein
MTLLPFDFVERLKEILEDPDLDPLETICTLIEDNIDALRKATLPVESTTQSARDANEKQFRLWLELLETGASDPKIKAAARTLLSHINSTH